MARARRHGTTRAVLASVGARINFRAWACVGSGCARAWCSPLSCSSSPPPSASPLLPLPPRPPGQWCLEEEHEKEPPVASRPSWRSGPVWFPTEGSRLCFHACRETLVRVGVRPWRRLHPKRGGCADELRREKVARGARCTLVPPRGGRAEGSPPRLGTPRSVSYVEGSPRGSTCKSKWTCGLQRR